MKTATSRTAAALFLTLASLSADTLRDRQDKVSAVIQKVQPAVVCLIASGDTMIGSGSGVVVDPSGLILTAAHVVDALAPQGADITIVFPDGRHSPAEILGRDRTRDAAMVRIKEPGPFPSVQLAPASSVELGEWCVALGHPGGFDVQRGVPVRLGRVWKNNENAFYRSDCTISGGDSGGPLFDLNGQLIGIHSNIRLDITENQHVPINVFHDEWDRLKDGKTWGQPTKVLSNREDLRDRTSRKKSRPTPTPPPADTTPPPSAAPSTPPSSLQPLQTPQPPSKADAPAPPRAWLGLTLKTSATGAALIESIKTGSPAEKAGLQLEDIILSIDTATIGSTGDLINHIQKCAPGQTLTLTIQRAGTTQQIPVTLAPRQ